MRDTGGERFRHLDGLRGLACLQVCLLHGFGLLMPALVGGPADASGIAAWIGGSPLRLLYDGETAVFVFFTLSGCVLTAPFARDAGHPFAAMAARLLRFAPPALAACALGWAALRWGGGVQAHAAALVAGSWLHGNLAADPTLGAWLRDGFGNALLLGYRGLSVWDAAPAWLALDAVLWPGTESFDPPLWTLSLELQGSALVLALTVLRRRSPAAWVAAVACSCGVLAGHPMLCFVAGHVAACLPPASATSRGGWMSAAAVSAGAALSLWGADGSRAAVAALSASGFWPMVPGLADVPPSRLWAAILIFAAALQGGRSFLGGRNLRWLGGLSFPLYLVHWTVLSGVGSAVVVFAEPFVGVAAAAPLALAGSAVGSVLAAYALQPIDRGAIDGARRLRRMLVGPRREAALPALVSTVSLPSMPSARPASPKAA